MPRQFLPVFRIILTICWLCGCGSSAAPGSDAGASDTGPGVFDLNADPWAGQVSGATAAFDPAASGWHGAPFPSDARRGADGHLKLADFPPTRAGVANNLLDGYLKTAEATLDGWGIQPTIYVAFDKPLNGESLRAATESLTQDNYFLINIDPASVDYGQVQPIESRLSGKARGEFLRENMLMAQPVWGKPLRPKTAYAFIVRRGWKDAEGKVLGQPANLTAILAAIGPGGKLEALDAGLQPLAKSLLPLQAALVAGKVSVPYKDIAAATVFTTGNPTRELGQMADWVREKATTSKVSNWEKKNANSTEYDLYIGTYKSPNFQQGKCPYADDGTGGFKFDAAGQPVVQATEDLRIAMAVPRAHDLNVDNKFPVALYAHGTGGNYLSMVHEAPLGVAAQLTAKGLVVIGIDQPLHGPRCVPEIGGSQLDFLTFNFLNIDAGRSGFRQSALDTVFLARLVREGKVDLPASVEMNGSAVVLDQNRVSFIGHSQGGLSGGLAAAVESNLLGYVLSGAGAGISLTIVLRTYPVDIGAKLALLLNLDKGELSEFHPTVSLVQMLADITDPLAYARQYFERPDATRAAHILLTEGLIDQDTPSPTAEALAASIGLDILAPVVHRNAAMKIAQTPALSGPVAGNITHGKQKITGVVSQWDGHDHFTIFTVQQAADMYAQFLASIAESDQGLAQHK